MVIEAASNRDELGRLVPTYNIQTPKWVGLYTGRVYKGRPSWWSELGHDDVDTMKARISLKRSAIRENDPDWFDPPVADGESYAGPFGKDSKFTRDYSKKGDEPGSLWSYKKKLMESSAQYKQIADKYDLSPEHPGIKVNPLLNSVEHSRWANLGIIGFLSPAQVGHQWGPRFFDKPLNEGCFEKGLSLVKYVAFWNVAVMAAEYQTTPMQGVPQVRVRDMVTRWVRLMPFPSALAFGYGVSICASATIRNKDDIYNPLYAALTTGILTTTIKGNVPLGVTYGLVLVVLGTVWQYQRMGRFGLQGYPRNASFGDSHWGGPHWWKVHDTGHLKPSDKVY